MINKYFDGIIPTENLQPTEFDASLKEQAESVRIKYEESMEKCNLVSFLLTYGRLFHAQISI